MPRRYSFKSQRRASINTKPLSNPTTLCEPSSPQSPAPQTAIPRCAPASKGPMEAPFPFSYFPFLYPIIHAAPLETGFIRVRHAVNLSKFLSLVVPLYFVYRFNAWENMTACLYVAMHGTYGVWWLVKNSIFPDRRWDAFCPLWYFCVVNVMLWSYFAIPYYICVNNVQLPAWRLMLTVMVWASGLLLTFIADFQKSLLMELAPGQLINTKFFTYVRNPNYLGEAMNYFAFCSLAGHWAPMMHQTIVILLACVPGIIMKERSLKRYPAFQEWKSKSWVYLPFIW